jgi:PAS domain S-box-containing protein
MAEKPTYEELEKRLKELTNVEFELKQAVEKIRQSEKRFRNLFEGSIQGILIHRNHKPLFVNEKWANIHGYSQEEVLAMDTVVQMISPKDQKRMVEYKKARLQGEDAPTDYEYQGVHKDGSLIWLDNRVSVVQWEEQEAIQTTIFDVTERKQVEAEREQLISELTSALGQIRKLSGLLPICSHCKKVRDDNGYWQKIEAYIEGHSEAEFSHSICQECAKKYFPDMDIYDENETQE